MTAARHKQVVQHPLRRRVGRVVLPTAAATLVTGTIVGVALATSGTSGETEQVAARRTPAPVHVTAASDYLADRTSLLSRSARRTTLEALPDVTGHKFMVAPLNVWPAPRESGDPLAVMDAGSKVAVTGVVRNGFAQVILGRQVRWVNQDYLRDKMPAAKPQDTTGPTGGGVLSSVPCASGSSMESGIVANAVALHRAVCAHFPQVTEYGGYRPDGEHADGHAIDIMVYSDSATGQAVADWVRANASVLHVSDVIWAQHIWTTQRASEGWRLMPDRGSTTANHYDHVHVRVY